MTYGNRIALTLAIRQAFRPHPLEVVQTQAADDIERLAARWPDADPLAALPSSQFGWMRACLTAFTLDASCRVLAIADGRRLLAAVPLVERYRHGLAWRCPPGAGELGEPVDVAWNDRPALDRLAAALVRDRTPLLLERLPADSAALAALHHACRGRAIALTRSAPGVPQITLDESWVEPERHLMAVHRHRLVRARHRAERLGPCSVQIHSPSLDELPRLLDVAFDVAFAAPRGEALRASELDRAVFYRQYAEAACMQGTLRICLLRFGARVAAAQVAVESGGALWLLHAQADPRYRPYWPQQQLARETIRYAAEANLESIEFWGPEQPWMRCWTLAQRACVTLCVYPLGFRGLAALVADTLVDTHGWWRHRRQQSAARNS